MTAVENSFGADIDYAIVLDLTGVEYVWGDGPVTSLVGFLREEVSSFRILANSANSESLERILFAAADCPGSAWKGKMPNVEWRAHAPSSTEARGLGGQFRSSSRPDGESGLLPFILNTRSSGDGFLSLLLFPSGSSQFHRLAMESAPVRFRPRFFARLHRRRIGQALGRY